MPTAQYYTVKEAAHILGFSTNSIYKFLAQGRLKSIRGSAMQGRFRISKRSLEDFLGSPIDEKQLQAFKPRMIAKPQVEHPITTETGTPFNPPVPLKITRMMILMGLVFIIADIFISKDFSLFQQLLRLTLIAMITLVTYQYGELSHS